MPRHTFVGLHRSWTEISAGLAAQGFDATRIHTEPFGPAAGQTPGIAATPALLPPTHPPDSPETAQRSRSPAATSRSGWSSDYGNLLELAESCDVPGRRRALEAATRERTDKPHRRS